MTDETDVMTQYMRSSFRIVNGVHEVLAPDFRGGPFGAPEVRAEDERELETVCEGYEILSPTQEWGERSGEDAADVDRLSPTQAVQPRRKRCRSRDDKPWRTTLEDRLSFPMTCKTMFADSGVAIRARGLREVVEIPKNRIYELLDLEAPEIRMAGRCLTSSRYATQLWFVANKLAHVANGNGGVEEGRMDGGARAACDGKRDGEDATARGASRRRPDERNENERGGGRRGDGKKRNRIVHALNGNGGGSERTAGRVPRRREFGSFGPDSTDLADGGDGGKPQGRGKGGKAGTRRLTPGERAFVVDGDKYQVGSPLCLYMRVPHLRHACACGRDSMEIGNLKRSDDPEEGMIAGKAVLEALVDRSTIFGNPFSMSRMGVKGKGKAHDAGWIDGRRREMLCEAYRDYIGDVLDEDREGTVLECAEAVAAEREHPADVVERDWARDFGAVTCRQFRNIHMDLREAAIDLEGRLRLMCHCAPKECHAGDLVESLRNRTDPRRELEEAAASPSEGEDDCGGCEDYLSSDDSELSEAWETPNRKGKECDPEPLTLPEDDEDEGIAVAWDAEKDEASDPDPELTGDDPLDRWPEDVEKGKGLPEVAEEDEDRSDEDRDEGEGRWEEDEEAWPEAEDGEEADLEGDPEWGDDIDGTMRPSESVPTPEDCEDEAWPDPRECSELGGETKGDENEGWMGPDEEDEEVAPAPPEAGEAKTPLPSRWRRRAPDPPGARVCLRCGVYEAFRDTTDLCCKQQYGVTCILDEEADDSDGSELPGWLRAARLEAEGASPDPEAERTDEEKEEGGNSPRESVWSWVESEDECDRLESGGGGGRSSPPGVRGGEDEVHWEIPDEDDAGATSGGGGGEDSEDRALGADDYLEYLEVAKGGRFRYYLGSEEREPGCLEEIWTHEMPPQWTGRRWGLSVARRAAQNAWERPGDHLWADRWREPMTCRMLFADPGPVARLFGVFEKIERPKERVLEFLSLPREVKEWRRRRGIVGEKYGLDDAETTYVWFVSSLVANRLVHATNGNGVRNRERTEGGSPNGRRNKGKDALGADGARRRPRARGVVEVDQILQVDNPEAGAWHGCVVQVIHVRPGSDGFAQVKILDTSARMPLAEKGVTGA